MYNLMFKYNSIFLPNQKERERKTINYLTDCYSTTIAIIPTTEHMLNTV